MLYSHENKNNVFFANSIHTQVALFMQSGGDHDSIDYNKRSLQNKRSFENQTFST